MATNRKAVQYDNNFQETIRIIYLSSTVLILIFSIIFGVFTKIGKKNTPLPTPEENPAGQGCVITGCNGEICQGENDEPVYSTCVYKDEYSCYQSASCEKQKNGKCGWTQTTELKTCLQKFR